MSKLSKFVFIVLWLFSSSLIIGEAVSLGIGEKMVSAKVDKRKIETGEIFTYAVTVQGNLEISAQLKLPEFKDLKVVSRRQSRNYAIKDGHTKTTITFTYHIFASKPGTYTIKPATLKNKENKYQSQKITIKVIGKPLKEKKKIQPYIDKGINL